MKKTIIYGLGERYHRFKEWLFEEIKDSYQIVALSDKNCPDTAYPVTFVEPAEIEKIDFDIIIVTSDRYFAEIFSELENKYGIDADKIISMDDVLEDVYRKLLLTDLFSGKCGVEIGGPSSIFANNIYQICSSCDGINYSQDTVWWKKESEQYSYKNQRLGEIIISDVVDLSLIEDAKYDFCISSNNLEHIANPIRALKEQCRILKKEGLMLVIVPMKDKCFDHNRDYTDFEHLTDDYRKNIAEDDLTHLDEIMEKHDFAMDLECGGREKFAERALKNYENRCLHHHVFHTEALIKIFEFLGIDVLKTGRIKNNYFIIGRR